MRKIKAVHKASYEPIADLVTYRVMPTEAVPINSMDPFIFLNHHGRQEYLPHNNGLPFGPHPHRGFETVTLILEGDLVHKDSSGFSSAIGAGGVQWMTAGKGIIHTEISSEAFKATGGPLEILQLWVNLPAAHKMEEPRYKGLQAAEIPVVMLDNNKILIHVISGKWLEIQGPFHPFTDISLAGIVLKEGGKVSFSIPPEQNILLYIIKGEVAVNGKDVRIHHLVEFENEGEVVELIANTDALALIGYATPFHESFAAYGPFVMNTREEIMQAYDDYNKGLMGREDDLR